jgi:Ca2+-binding EF-hand superfamily protein
MVAGLEVAGVIPAKGQPGHVPSKTLKALLTAVLALATKDVPKFMEAAQILFTGQLDPKEARKLHQLLQQYSSTVKSKMHAGDDTGMSEADADEYILQVFNMTDKNQSGLISYDEFCDLTESMGLQLTENRTRYLFNLGDQVCSPTPPLMLLLQLLCIYSLTRCLSQNNSDEIDKDEFVTILDQLKEELSKDALSKLGFSNSQLATALTIAVTLLLCFFVFLYFGIEAFTAGTSFGAVINSSLATLGGAAGSSEAEEEDEDDNTADEGAQLAVTDSLNSRSLE